MKLLKLVLAFLFLVICTFTNGQDYSLFEKKQVVSNGVVLPYRILFPVNYDKKIKYPLFIYFHGMGRRGNDNSKQLDLGANLFLSDSVRNKYPAIIVYPQAPVTSAFCQFVNHDRVALPWNRDLMKNDSAELVFTEYGNLVYSLVSDLINDNIVDKTRIYISGSSMGGFTVYKFLEQYPDLIAAAAPICGGTPVKYIQKWADEVPVAIYHGTADETVPVEVSRKIVAELKKLHANYRFKEYPGIGHNCMPTVFSEPDFVSWFFKFKRTQK